MKRPKPSMLSDARLKALLKGLREEVAAPRDFRAGVLERLRQEGLLASSAAEPPRAEAASSWTRRLAGLWSSRAGWGLGLGSALALALVLRIQGFRTMAPALVPPAPGLTAPSSAPSSPAGLAASAAAPRGSHVPAALAASRSAAGPQARTVVASRPAAPAQVQSSVIEVSDAQEAPAPAGTALGSAQGPALSQGSSVAAVSAAPAVQSGVSAAGSAVPGVFGGAVQQSALRSALVAADDSKGGSTTPTAGTTPTLSRPLAQNSQVRNNVILASRGQSAQILFTVAQAGPVLVKIYDRLGRPVAVLEDDTRPAGGPYSLSWSGATDSGAMAASGIYIVLIRTPTYLDKHKMMLVK